MEEEQVVEAVGVEAEVVENGDAPESEQAEQAEQGEQQADGLLSQDKQELSERVAHLEKRVREQEDEIVCLKGALADVMRRLVQLETTKSTNSILPSKPLLRSPRRAPSGQDRPKSVIESYTPRSNPQSSARASPRGQSASSIKKWNSMSNSIEDTNGHKSPRHPSAGSLTQSNGKDKDQSNVTWNSNEKYIRMYLKGRPVPLYASDNVDTECYKVDDSQGPPDKKLELEWVYGYRGRDCRSNLYQLPTGEVLYFSAAVVILHNLTEQTQRHYCEHTDDIKCIAIHPDKVRVASGQVAGHDKKEGKSIAAPAGRKPHVRVWDHVSLNTLLVIGEGYFRRGVCCVSFSNLPGEDLMLAVDESDDHVLSVWDLSKKKHQKIAEMKSSGDPVTACEWHPKERSIVCCGKSQISFWTLEEDNQLNKKSGIFEKNEKPKVVICFAFAENGDVLSGDSNGNIYVWAKGSNRISQACLGAHEGAVFSLCTTKNGNFVSGGGKDRKIYEWDCNYQKTGQEAEIPERFGAVRMISSGQGNMLLVGTVRNCILQGTIDHSISFSPAVEGHKEELWGLDTLPGHNQFLTCGYDRHIYMWDSMAHSCVWMKEVNEAAHCCAINPHGHLAAIGYQTGKFMLLDLSSHEILAVYSDGKEQIECLEFSPNGSMIAAGCRDNIIYIYDLENEKTCHKLRKCSGHSSYVTHIDWSADGGEYIRSNSGDYEVLYWRSKNGKQETNKDVVRSLDWVTQNCTLSFNSVGVWPDMADGTDVNNCSASHDKKLLVSADDFGKVNLYEYPSIHHKATGHSYLGHSSHVTQAKFLYDDSRVISTGGRDYTVCQWKVV